MGQTFVFLKPDALERKLKGNILQLIEDAGFTVEATQEVSVTKERILTHYDEVIHRLKSKDFVDSILKEFVGKTVECMVLSHDGEAIHRMRELLGATNPALAGANTIRGRYGNDSYDKANAEGRMIQNLMHASDAEATFEKERALWFDDAGIQDTFDYPF